VTDEGVVVWVTGPSQPTIERVAKAIREKLTRRHVATELLASQTAGIDVLAGDGFERRVAFAAHRLVHHGIAVVVAIPSPSRHARDEIRAWLRRMIEVYVPVGGGGAAFEPPARPEVQIDFPESELDAAVERTMRTLELLGYLRPASDTAYSADEEREVIKRLKSFGYL
jgi:adenylylsulfate kinase-like enzyme